MSRVELNDNMRTMEGIMNEQQRAAFITTKLSERLVDAWSQLDEARKQHDVNDIAYWNMPRGNLSQREQIGKFVEETIWPVESKIYQLEKLIIRLSFRLSLVSDFQSLPDDYFWR